MRAPPATSAVPFVRWRCCGLATKDPAMMQKYEAQIAGLTGFALASAVMLFNIIFH